MKILALPDKQAARGSNIFLARFIRAPHPNEGFFAALAAGVRARVTAFARRTFRGEAHETKWLWLERQPERVVLFGLGEQKKWNERSLPTFARRLVRFAKTEKLPAFTAPLPEDAARTPAARARIFAANAVMANYEYTRLRAKPRGGWPSVKTITLGADAADLAEVRRGIREGVTIGEETNRCRELADTPGGEMTPTRLADAARDAAGRTGMKITVLGRRELEKLGMGGVLGVSRGSAEEPKFIILEYAGNGINKEPLVLVGKGVTFDTGGLNLKPGDYIYEMHMDMSGGAAVIHGMAAAARLGIGARIIGLVPAVENMPSGSSYRPGDVLKSFSGKTIEVLNTDAEGRVILADALAYGAKHYRPKLMVDIATLTGAAQAALGRHMSAVFANRESLIPELIDIGATSGDYVWPLPLWDEYLDHIKGTFGDLANVGKKGYGGDSINGAKFLEQFAGAGPWAHLDIAPRMTAIDSEYLAKGASGVGVRYIVELARRFPELKNRAARK